MPPAPTAKPPKKQITPVTTAVFILLCFRRLFSLCNRWASAIAAISRSSEAKAAARAASAAAWSMASLAASDKSSISVSTSNSLYRFISFSLEFTSGVVGGSPNTGIFQKLIKRTIANILLQCLYFILRLHILIDFPIPLMEEPEHQDQDHQNKHTRRPGDYPFPKAIHVTPYLPAKDGY
jgi:hypothetical protein